MSLTPVQFTAKQEFVLEIHFCTLLFNIPMKTNDIMVHLHTKYWFFFRAVQKTSNEYSNKFSENNASTMDSRLYVSYSPVFCSLDLQ